MPFLRAGQLARETSFARPDDALGLVAENLRESQYGTIPVFDSMTVDMRELRHAQLLGVIDERDLSRAVSPILERERVTVPVNGHGTPNEYSNGRGALNGHALNGNGLPHENTTKPSQT
jgi:hypothetical protein